MSRSNDIMYVEEQIRLLQEKQRQIVEEFDHYRVSVDEAITNLLQEAGVLNTLNDLRAKQNKAQKQGQEQLDQIGSHLNELQSVLRFLQHREQNTPEPPLEEMVQIIKSDVVLEDPDEIEFDLEFIESLEDDSNEGND